MHKKEILIACEDITSLLVNCRAFLPSKKMLYSLSLGMISFLKVYSKTIQSY